MKEHQLYVDCQPQSKRNDGYVGVCYSSLSPFVMLEKFPNDKKFKLQMHILFALKPAFPLTGNYLVGTLAHVYNDVGTVALNHVVSAAKECN